VEASAETIHRAHATHPITAVQSEFSLWTRDPEDEVLGTLRELGIGLVAYSPLGRGFLTGQIRSLSDLPEDDWRRTNPRFQEDALRENLQLADRVVELARQRGITPAQLALAWIMAKGEDIVPIPGTKSPQRIEENAAAAQVELSAEEIDELDNAISPNAVRGSRYAEQMMALLDN
jgi:aryl-alcohol dehydrogenase-like predicted oxidoreductase